MGKNNYLGDSLDDFLDEEDLLEEVEQTAIKRVLAFQILKLMKEQKLTKTEMAHLMHTSRAALGRLLDPKNESITLQTLKKAAHVLGKKIKIHLV